MKEITVLNELKTLSPSKADQIEAAFKPMVVMLKDMEVAFDMVMGQKISPELCKKAKRLRLDIAKIRISADKVRAAEKKQYTVGANAIQGMYNILKFGTSEKEDALKFVEDHYIQIEAERKQKCENERQVVLSAYAETVGVQQNLSDKSDQEWDEYLDQVKKWDQERLDKIEAARIEQEEIAKKEREALEESIREDERKKIEAKKISKAQVKEILKKKPIAVTEEKSESNNTSARRDKSNLSLVAQELLTKYEWMETQLGKKAINEAYNVLIEAANEL